MPFQLKTRKSAGVRVTPTVHRLIAQGNTARDAANWAEAASVYGEALALAPELGHIHVQRGNALREEGLLDEADAAYAAAARTSRSAEEAIVRRAHLASARGHPDEAARILIDAIRSQRQAGALEEELGRLAEPGAGIPCATLRDVLADIDGIAQTGDLPASEPRRLFEVSDLLNHFRAQRLPNGIERVQVEVLSNLLNEDGEGAIGLVCFVPARDGWVEVSASALREAMRLATTESDVADPAWQAARARLFLAVALGGAAAMPAGSVLVNLGTGWWAHDYFRHIRNARRRSGLRYVPMVYDLIPAMAPHLCLPDIVRDFASWVTGAVDHADGFLTISRHSGRDLRNVAARLGRDVAETSIEVIPLDADFRRAAGSSDAPGLAPPEPFALMVSTIEARKNHALAFDAWSELLRRHGAAAVPRLVCVGRDGWLNEHAFARLDLDPRLAAHVTLIPRASDEELAELYRRSLFTVYPSLYEGWGLPVTESLSHGRVPVVADATSLPEAGGDLALMFPSGDRDALVTAVEQACDDGWRAGREAEIAVRFVPRPWRAIASQVGAGVTRLLADSAKRSPLPRLRSGVYYPVRLRRALRDADEPFGGGEDVRIGEGWLWPEADGCRTMPQGGEVRFHIEGGKGPVRLLLRVRGLAGAVCSTALLTDGAPVKQVAIPAGETRWLDCDTTGPDVGLMLHGEGSEMVETPHGRRAASVALLGILPVLPDTPPDKVLAAIDEVVLGPVASRSGRDQDSRAIGFSAAPR